MTRQKLRTLTVEEALEEADELTRQIADARANIIAWGRRRGQLWHHVNRNPDRGQRVSLPRIAERAGVSVNRVADSVTRCAEENGNG